MAEANTLASGLLHDRIQHPRHSPAGGTTLPLGRIHHTLHPDRGRELAATHVRYGNRRLTVLVRREGWHVNGRRIYWLWAEKKLIVRTKQRRNIARRLRVAAKAQ